MIRIDEIYSNVFSPIILSKPKQSMHYFDPFGRTDIDALNVTPLIIERDRAFLIWDQEPFYPEVHSDTVEWFYKTFALSFSDVTNVTLAGCAFLDSNVSGLCLK